MNKIAVIQMNTSGNLLNNLNTAKLQIAHAAQAGAKVIVLPEMFATLGMEKIQLDLISESFGQNGTIQNFLKDQAKTNQIWLIGGTIPIKSKHANKFHAACLVYNDTGECVARYDKIHLFDATVSDQESYHESDSFIHGEDIVTVDTPIGKIGLIVCYDIRFPELTRQLFMKNVDIIAVPTAFTAKTGAPHWENLTRCRAIENQCYIAAACQTGTHANERISYGHSCIIDPWGQIIDCLPSHEGFIIATINHDLIQKIKTSMPIRSHIRIPFSD